MTFLFDTNVISELFRRKPNTGVIKFTQQIRRTHIGAITLDEIFFGLAAKPKPQVLTALELFVESQCIVLPVDDETAGLAGKLRGYLQTKGTARSQADMLIAATAQQHSLTLGTRNEKDFRRCSITAINPFI